MPPQVPLPLPPPVFDAHAVAPAAAGLPLAPHAAVTAMAPLAAAASAQQQEVGHRGADLAMDVYMRDLLNIRVESVVGSAGIVLGRYNYKFRGATKVPILFVGGPSSPSGYEFFKALKLALSTVLYPASVLDQDRTTQDDLMCSLIDSGPGIKLNVITRTNIEFGKHLIQMLSLFFLFNDFRQRCRLNDECDSEMMLCLGLNQSVLLEFFMNIFPNDRGLRCFKLFRSCVAVDCSQDPNKILAAIKYLGEKARRGIWCDWASTQTHKNCIFVHHFMVMQTFHSALMVTDKSTDNRLMNGNHCFTFHGGTWETFFNYDDTVGVVGSRISWRGTGGED